jgi:hypothetical protein
VSVTYARPVIAKSDAERCVIIFGGSGNRCDYAAQPTALPCPSCGGRVCAECERVSDRHDPIACKIRLDGGRPFVGAPASYGYGSDSYPATVIEVSKSGHRITLQHDRTEVVAGSGADGTARHICSPDPDGSTVVATRRADGRYRIAGCSNFATVYFGRSGRRAYRDPSF